MKFLTRTIIFLSLISFFNDISSEMLIPVMPIFLKNMGFSVLLIGILEGLAEAIAGISKGYFGAYSDQIGKRVPFIRIGYLMSAVAKPMMALFAVKAWIFSARTLDRIGKGVRTGARDALLSDESTNENKGKVFGFHRALDTLGAVIGPILAMIFLYYFPGDYKALFMWTIVPGIAVLGLTLLLN